MSVPDAATNGLNESMAKMGLSQSGAPNASVKIGRRDVHFHMRKAL